MDVPSELYPTSDLEDWAVMSALYELDTDVRSQVEAQYGQGTAFAETVQGFEMAVTALPYAAPPVPIHPQLKGRLFERLGLPIPEPDLFDLLSLSIAELKQKADTLSWQAIPIAAGVEIATLQTHAQKHQFAFFVRADGPALFPLHRHAAGEVIWVLEGDLVLDEQSYQAGDRIWSEPETAHQPKTLAGCLLFCVASTDDEYLV